MENTLCSPISQVSAVFPANASWLEINALHLKHNISLFRQVSEKKGNFEIGVVLKGNAYGHGFLEVLSVVHDLVDCLYVITPQDAFSIRAFERQNCKRCKKVLVLGSIGVDEAVLMANQDIEATLADPDWGLVGQALRTRGMVAPLKVHVHIDTGLGREGILPTEVLKQLGFLKEFSDIFQVVGVLSHFANTEDVTEQSYALQQVEKFHEGEAHLRTLLGSDLQLVRHISASAAAFVLPPARLEAVRVGISLYGLWSSIETRISSKVVFGDALPALKPVLSWRCQSQMVKRLAAGSYVGYGCTYRCEEDTRVAVFPVGYFDGYPRLMSSRAHVLINGHRCPVLGRIMMNHIVVNVSRAATDDSPLIATLLGTDGSESISADTLAAWAQTINYEMVTRIGSHLKRIVTLNE